MEAYPVVDDSWFEEIRFQFVFDGRTHFVDIEKDPYERMRKNYMYIFAALKIESFTITIS